MSTATVAAIRDQHYALVEALTPTSLSGDKFRRFRNEGEADFPAAMEANPAGCFRRLQVRQVGTDEMPEVSNTTEERVRVQLETRIAYPQTERFGGANAMDRDDVINEDWKLVNRAIGIYGRGNFSGTNDCTPLGATMEMERSDGVDYMVVTSEYEYVRSVT